MKNIQFLLILFIPYLSIGQSLSVKESRSESQQPDITWSYPQKLDSMDFTILRASVKDGIFKPVKTFHYQDNSLVDTSLFVMIDTTLVEKGIYLYKLQLTLHNKKVESAIAFGHNYDVLPRPKLRFFNAVSLPKHKGVKLSWEFNYDKTLKSIELYRSKKYDTGYIKIMDLPAQSSEYIDYVDIANEAWFYFIKPIDYFGELLPSVRIPVIPTFGDKPIAPLNFIGKRKEEAIILKWRNPNPVKSYKVFRKTDKETGFQQITELVLNDSTDIEFVDNSDILKEVLDVEYCVTHVNDAFLESTYSDTLKFHFLEHEKVFPPSTIDHFRQGEYTKLVWQKPKEGMTFAYNVYLTDSDNVTTLLTPKSVGKNYYIDSVLRPAGIYTYAIEGVGYKGKKSELKSSIVVKKDKIKFHVILNLRRAKNGIEISWDPIPGKAVKRYRLYKKYGKSKLMLKKSFASGKAVKYIDLKVKKGTNYLYVLKAELENGEMIEVNPGVSLRY